MVKFIALVTTTLASKGLQRQNYDLKKGKEVEGVDSQTLQYCLTNDIIKKVVTKDVPENKELNPADENKGGDTGDTNTGDTGGEGDAHKQIDIEDKKSYTAVELEAMPMQDIRKIGNIYEVKDNVKDELIGKILKAQEAAATPE